MPLSTPVDTNPIVKEPTLFTDGSLLPSNTTINSLDLTAISGVGDKDIVYNPDDNEYIFLNLVAIGGGSFDTEIRILDGFTSTIKTSFLAVNDVAAIAYHGGFIYGVGRGGNDSDSRFVYKINKTDGSTEQSFDLSGTVSQLRDIAFLDGDLIVSDNRAGIAEDDEIFRFKGISTTLKNTLNYETTYSAVPSGIAFYNGDLLVLEGLTDQIRVLTDFTLSQQKLVDVSGIATNLRFVSVNGTPDAVVMNNDTAWILQSEDNGKNFTANSSKTLESGKVYSFKIQGPNSDTAPTLNDDGQGQFPIVLPGGASIPVGALTGNFDFLFNGTQYVIVSLTRELAEAIYDIPSNLSLTEGETYARPTGGTAEGQNAATMRSILSVYSQAEVDEYHPETATDGGTDAYASETTTATPDDGDIIVREFDSVNTTATPTLDSNTIVDPNGDGYAGMIEARSHRLQWDNGNTRYVLLDPGLGNYEKQAKIATGTYTGDGTTSQSITGIGFAPKYVKVSTKQGTGGNAVYLGETTDVIVDDDAGGITIEHDEAGGHTARVNQIISLDADGFTVDDAGSDLPPNKNGTEFNYLAIG